MHKFNEELLQFIWRHKLLKPLPLVARSGNVLSILHPGELNVDAGPDFFNAQIRVNNVVLAGNVEVHVKSSDWLKHRHDKDRSYDTIILHAVYEHDIDLDQNTNHQVEVVELKHLIDEKTLVAYETLAGAKSRLPCASQLNSLNELKFISWLERMTVERLEYKVKQVKEWFLSCGKDYAQTFYTCLLRSFGFKVNALPFELIAKHLPVQLVLKHAGSREQLEALLLGMAGFLEDCPAEKYLVGLKNEFEFLKHKYQLRPLQKELFKFSKLRPPNFPTLRLAQLARLIHVHPEIFTSPQHTNRYSDIVAVLKPAPEGYWKNHYKFDGGESLRDLAFGTSSAEKVIINAFAPFLFFYSKKLAKPEYATAAIELLNACKAELNVKTKLFAARKSSLQNAASSQGIIHLYDNFCSSRKCLKCGIAAAILNPA